MRASASPHNRNFLREMERLNAAQRAAVAQIDGPVMVLAGPGTGKTHLLAARIGNILTETDTGAHNILCLTFTEAGVKAMRERLLHFIGPEAHRIGIFTFHGFCNTLIQRNLQYFGKPELEPVSELEKIRIVRQILEQLGAHSPLRQGYHDKYFYEPHLRHLFAAIKSENWTVDGIEQAIDRYVGALPTHPDFIYKRAYKDLPKGAPKAGQIAEEIRRMERLRAAVHCFPAYQQALRRQHRYDFGDMIGWVLRAFNDFPTLLRAYQERYQYVLVDEFQDTNGAQDAIVRSLVDYWERPNVFIVGDDDQAIYEFQGARLRAMTDFFHRYEGVKLVTLTENYRSRQEILDAASVVIANNTLRIGHQLPGLATGKQLVASHPGFRPGSVADGSGAATAPLTTSPAPAAAPTEKTFAPVRLLEFTDPQQETGYLIHQLRQWQAAGVPWHEMAIIYANHRQADALRLLLERADIPYYSRRRPNVLDERSVRQLRELLTWLQAEYERPGTGEHLLYRLLHFRCFDLLPHDLALLNRARLQATTTDGGCPSWRMFLQQPEHWPTGLTATSRLLGVVEWLEEMIGRNGSLPLAEYVEQVMNGSGLLPAVLRAPARAKHLPYLTTFADFVLAEVARHPRLSLGDLLDTLRQMDANRVALPLRSHLEQAEAVLLVTAHSAKGLEFDKVWMLDCSDKTWGQESSGGQRQFKLPDTLTFSGSASEEEARRRLFFVALTRARTEVVVSVAQHNARGRPQQRAIFLDEIAAATDYRLETASLGAEAAADMAALRLQPSDPGQLPGWERAAITELLKGYRLSVSGLYSYLNCPTAFFYEKLLRVPDLEREENLYGSALHDTLEAYFLRMKQDTARIFPSQEELLYYFTQMLGRRRGLFSPESFNQRLEQGQRELARYHDQHRHHWVTDVETELMIRNVEVDGIPLTGVIDRVDILSDAAVRVVDYKTSGSGKRVLSSKIKGPTPAKPAGGNYWRQLNFYKLLYDYQPGNIRRVKEGVISFLLLNTEGEQPEASVSLQPKDQAALRAILREAWEGIQAQQFTGCGEADCAWCQFVADFRQTAPLEKPDNELDDPS